jgi:hypothetical protein
MYFWFLFKALLFVAYVPGVLFRLLPSYSTRVQALVHGVLYVVVLHLVYQMVFHVERMTNPSTKGDSGCPAGSHKCPSGDCVLDGDKHSPCR